MKIMVEMDLEHGSGSIRWKRASWRRIWWLCVAVSGLLVASDLMTDRLDLVITRINAKIGELAPNTDHRA